MLKQVIIVRKDLKMKGGKLASQVSHASMGAITQYLVEKKKYIPVLKKKMKELIL